MTAQGASERDTGQLTVEWVREMSKAKRYGEIEAARVAGRLTDLLAGRPIRKPRDAP